MGWLCVPLLGAVIGFMLGAVPLFRIYGRREYERGLRQWEHEPVDVSVECACGAQLSITDATANGTEPILVAWWQWHGEHHVSLDQYRTRLTFLHNRPDMERIDFPPGEAMTLRHSAVPEGWADQP